MILVVVIRRGHYGPIDDRAVPQSLEPSDSLVFDGPGGTKPAAQLLLHFGDLFRHPLAAGVVHRASEPACLVDRLVPLGALRG